MANCIQACPYNTLDGCKVKEYNEICPFTNMATPVTEYRTTNADKIRSMTDEELAEQLIQYRDDWGDYCTHKGCYATQKEAVEAEIEWLKQQEE